MSLKAFLKELRKAFRAGVLKRDGHKCKKCGIVPEDGDEGLDAHHIIDRDEIPNGGYALENGISLCKLTCHYKAEAEHRNEVPEPGFSRTELFELIGSSREKAIEASEKLGCRR